MKRSLLGLFFLATLLINAGAQTSPVITTFILVRHAEKGNDGTDDPDLKAEGHERAKRLATLLSNGTVSAVYSTKYKRTKNTVTPLAQAKGLEVQVYESLKAENLNQIISQNAGGTIVVAGHSNTVPQIANALLGKEEFQNFADSEYGNVLVVSVVEKAGSGKVVRLSY